jgi:transcriptional regulator with XRE-family HTH domain
MRLKRVRAARGMSQDAVAKAARITREYLSRLEAGRYDPTVGVLQRLAKALRVRVTELLE